MHGLGPGEHKSSLFFNCTIKNTILLLLIQPVKEFPSSIASLIDILIVFVQDTNFHCDGLSSFLYITSDHYDKYSCVSAVFNRLFDFWSGWIQNTYNSNKNWLRLDLSVVTGFYKSSVSFVRRSVIVLQISKVLFFVSHK